MNCLETRKYLSAFLDNELDTRTNIEVVEHLRMCGKCEGRLEELGQLETTVSSYVKSVRAPQSLRDRVARSLLDPAVNRRRVSAVLKDFTANGWVRALTAAASILIVFTAVYVVLLRPPAAFSVAAVDEHMAVMRDQVATFIYTSDHERAQRLGLMRLKAKPPAVPLMDKSEFQLVGAMPLEIELKNVGHFVFRYRNETISMFVFEGMGADEVGGREMQTPLGAAKIGSRRGMNVVAWSAGDFTYVLVSKMPAKDLLDKVAPSVLSK